MITTPNTNSFTCKTMKSTWSHYNIEHIHYFNKRSIKELADITGFEIVGITPFWKILTIEYMQYIFEYNNKKFLSKLFFILKQIPLLNRFEFSILVGEFLVILRSKK